jgi:hypothetical protein
MKQSFNSIFKVAAFALAIAGMSAQAYRIPFYGEANNKFQLDGTKTYTETYANWTFKITDAANIVVETKNYVRYKDEELGKGIDHAYIRVFWNQPKIAQFGAWTFGSDFRWRLPTAQSLQVAGSFGALAIRPYLSTKFGSVNFKYRNLIEVFVNKDGGRPVNVKRGGVNKGNKMFTVLPEVIFAWEFAPGFVFAPTASYEFTRNSAAPGSDSGSWYHELWSEWEINYTHPRYTLNTTVGVSLENTLEGFNNLDNKKPFQKAHTTFNVKLSRVF